MSDDLHMRATAFADRWRGRGDENSETQQYWMDLLGNVLRIGGLSDRHTLWFERRTAGNGLIDALMIEARVLVEQKSLGVDLDRPEPRQGEMKTPVRQALDYANALPPSERPTVLITCNFSTFRLYDLETDPLAGRPQSEFTLDELPAHAGELARLFSHEHSRVVATERLSVEAGRRVARLHDGLAARYPDPDDPTAHTMIAMLTVRLVFCLYAEDAGLFTHDLFRDYIAASTPDRLAGDLYDLFRVLDQPAGRRRRFLPERLAGFPYVDGGLFADDIDIPPLDGNLYDALLSISEGFDWSGISPVIFGSLMEETLSHDERRRGGMHYTTVRNIHRVIDPLFLDGLKADLEAAEARPVAGGARSKALRTLHGRLAGLRFLDPACGSGNFLTETFLELRRLENRILNDLNADGQLMLDLDGDASPVKVSIDRFHGIEINAFACAVARTALWIAEQQALDDTESIISGLPRLPFTDTAHIMCANALRCDWNQVLDGAECDYVMGNPPFIGHITKSPEQTADLKAVWGKGYDGYLDYATGWYRKAASYLSKPDAAFAFVSTNSITQGLPVGALFRPLETEGWRIRFAHRSFAWDAQSTDNAAVHVVIIGMDRRSDTLMPPRLYSYPDINGNGVLESAGHINGYLLDAPDIYVDRRSQGKGALSPELHTVDTGSMPLDGGHLLIDTVDEHTRAMSDPIAAKYVHPFRMGRELINGGDRWCLWLTGAEPRELRTSRFLNARVSACARYRENAPVKGDAYRHRNTPWLFRDDHQPTDGFLAIPKVFSEGRRYMTCDWYGPDIIVGDMVFTTPDPEGLAFAVIESRMFMVWQQTVGGRLESRCRFSSTVVWNNLPLPRMDDGMRAGMAAAGHGVLEARRNHPGQSLADLYDPDCMPLDLRRAHESLDRVADVAFGAAGWLKHDDDMRLKVLFGSYARLTGQPQ